MYEYIVCTWYICTVCSTRSNSSFCSHVLIQILLYVKMYVNIMLLVLYNIIMLSCSNTTIAFKNACFTCIIEESCHCALTHPLDLRIHVLHMYHSRIMLLCSNTSIVFKNACATHVS